MSTRLPSPSLPAESTRPTDASLRVSRKSHVPHSGRAVHASVFVIHADALWSIQRWWWGGTARYAPSTPVAIPRMPPSFPSRFRYLRLWSHYSPLADVAPFPAPFWEAESKTPGYKHVFATLAVQVRHGDSAVPVRIFHRSLADRGRWYIACYACARHLSRLEWTRYLYAPVRIVAAPSRWPG